MIKKCVSILIVLSLVFALCGCWNYRGLNELTVIIGIAIDKNEDNGYKLTFETVDFNTSVEESGPKSEIIESEGKTIFDAVRNAKKRVNNKLYFGQAQTVIISEELGREQNIGELMDWFMRDGECRETMCFVISQEKTAAEILATKGVGQPLVANEIKKIVEGDPQVTVSTVYVELYEIFNMLKAPGEDVVLPAIHTVNNGGVTACEINGIAVYRGQKLAGYLTPEESKYFMFAVDEVKKGLLTLTGSEDMSDLSLEISKNKTRTSFRYKDKTMVYTIKTETQVYLGEYLGEKNSLSEKQMEAIEDAAEKEIENNITAVVKKAQNDFDADIFGFGNMVYKKDNDLWQELQDQWDELFQNATVEVKSNVRIVNTGVIKKS